jgi:protein-S-isoprenylcysteine O-methyltransferase Ste14
MPTIALLLDGLFVLAGLVLRTVVQWRRTGDTGWRLTRPASGAAMLAHAALCVSPALLIVASAVALVGNGPEPPLPLAVVGGLVALGGIGLVAVAQFGMGSSWRIGLDPSEQTALVTDGVYRSVRNPIYTGIGLFFVGQALLVPGMWSAAAFVVGMVGIEVQVRLVEEPYLLAFHGASYREWVAATGRFVPRLGVVTSR